MEGFKEKIVFPQLSHLNFFSVRFVGLKLKILEEILLWDFILREPSGKEA